MDDDADEPHTPNANECIQMTTVTVICFLVAMTSMYLAIGWIKIVIAITALSYAIMIFLLFEKNWLCIIFLFIAQYFIWVLLILSAIAISGNQFGNDEPKNSDAFVLIANFLGLSGEMIMLYLILDQESESDEIGEQEMDVV